MFEGLEEFGLHNMEDKPLYQDEDDEKEIQPGPVSERPTKPNTCLTLK